MPSSIILLAVSAILWLAGCTEVTPGVPFAPQELRLPATNPATGPRITGNQHASLVLSWMQPRDDGTALNFARYEDGAWTDASNVVLVDGMFINWADLPSVIALGEGRFAAHWLQKSGASTYAYDVAARISTDEGRSWSKIITPHTDGTDTEHGFVSMFAYESQLGMLWLDGRKFINEVSDDPTTSGMTLRATRVDADLQLRNEQLVDELVCDCCQTDIAIASDGPVAVYRDRSIDEIRDISVSRFAAGRWRAGQTIADDQWRIHGCPVNGPSITAAGDVVAAAWFTGADNKPTIKLAVSQDGGRTFAEPMTVISGSVLGHVDLVQLDEDEFAVSWLQVSDGGIGELKVRKITTAGEAGAINTVSYGASSFSVPQMGRAGDELVFVWTESEDFADRILSAKVPIAALNDVATN